MDNIFAKCSNIKLLFEGGQKKVYKAFHPEFGDVVLKHGEFNSATNLERIRREVNFLRTIDSEYFPKTYDFLIDSNTNQFLIVEEFVDSKKLYDLHDYYNSESQLIKLLRQLITGLKILWSKNIVHRDIKPDNILITKDHFPKIIDLGIARFIDYESLTKTIAFSGPCTPIYAAPEQLLNKKQLINMRTDFFSLGIVLLELHLGFHPYSPEKVGNHHSIPENILNGIYVKPSEKEKTSMEFSNLINKLLKVEPFQRFRNYQILEDFINENWSHNESLSPNRT